MYISIQISIDANIYNMMAIKTVVEFVSDAFACTLARATYEHSEANYIQMSLRNILFMIFQVYHQHTVEMLEIIL